MLGGRKASGWASADCLGPDSRFLKLPGKTALDRGSCPEQLQGRGQGEAGFKADVLAVSP